MKRIFTMTALTLLTLILTTLLSVPDFVVNGATTARHPVASYALVNLLVPLRTNLPHFEGVDSSQDQAQTTVEKYAPLLHFDSKQGQKNKCFPSDAGQYFEARKSGNKDRICNTDYDTISTGTVPIYYQWAYCNKATYISYWFFYGWQDTCSPGKGSHDADWERVVVKVVDGKPNRVMFFQHKGQYTRTSGNFKVSGGSHPEVYVGKNSHGSYHDSGGSATCCYWEDFRNPGKSNKKMETWRNLVYLSKDAGRPEWMRYEGTEYWDGLTGPLFRTRDNNLCDLQGCRGAHTPVCHTGGCWKSDIGSKKM